MSVETLIALVLFLFPLAYSPGPGNAFFAGIGASQGLRAAVPALVGYHAATFIVTVVIGLGMGASILENPIASTVLGALGSVYVLWLAFTFVRAARTKAGTEKSSPTEHRRIGWWAGAIVLVLNPKAYYIIAVMFTQFFRPPTDNNLVAVLIITTVFTLNNLVAFVAWTVGGRALTMLFRGERAKRWIDYLFAATLVGVAVWMALPLFA